MKILFLAQGKIDDNSAPKKENCKARSQTRFLRLAATQCGEVSW